MLEVLECFEGTQSFELVEQQEHVRRIVDMVVASSAFEMISLVL